MSTSNANLVNWPIADVIDDLPPPASLAESIGDLLYYDAATGTVKPFSAKTTLASEVLDQIDAAAKFVGVSNSARIATQTDTTGQMRVITDRVFEFPCPSQTFDVGDYVGPTWNGGAALVDQFVTKVARRSLSIGRVVKKYGSATTLVKCRLLGRISQPHPTIPGIGGQQGTDSAVFPDADTALTVGSAPIQVGVPTAARVATLPAEAQSAGLMFFFVNNSAGAFSITVKNAAAATIATIAQNKRGIVWCDGTTWFGGAFA
jgi:hypothetical protein